MKIGDLVHMPHEHVPAGFATSIGIIVADDYPRDRTRRKRRIGVMWQDGDRVDYEPIAWLEVINESR